MSGTRLSPVLAALLLLASVAVTALSAPPAVPEGPPEAPARPITETHWGTRVVDPYRYMESVADPEVEGWARAQNAFTRTWLDAVEQRDAILQRVVELTHSDSPSYGGLAAAGKRIIALKHQPPREQSFLVVFADRSLQDERVLVDPNEIDPSGGTSIDFFVPSDDGRLVAVSMSRHGTEDGTLHIFDTANGDRLEDEIPRVNGGTAGGSVAWTPDGKGLYYTRYPGPGERRQEDLFFYQQVWFHTLGTALSDDRYELGEGLPRIAEIELATSPDGRHVVAEVSYGDGGEYAYYLKGPAGEWRRIADYADKVVHAVPGRDGLYLLSRDGAPNKKIMLFAYDAADIRQAKVVVPEGEAVIRAYLPTASRLFVVEMLGGPMQLSIRGLDGSSPELVKTADPSSIGSLVKLEGDEILLQRQSYKSPPAWYRYLDRLESTPLVHESPADFDDCVVRREYATAEDGTRIPITVIMRRGTHLDGSSPLLLYGYGSYGFTMSPYFSAHRRLWIEQGGIYAVANIRGGGAYGDDWHRAANLENKKVSIDDFAACARRLAERGYTSPQRLAIEGGSAGGLLVYGTMVHHPEVAAAVIAKVGLADMVRVETSPNGEFNITEFGTVTDQTQFRGLVGYSPYHHVRDGVAYPAVLATTGMNDPRVEPWQSFKMVARLQASGTSEPVLLRVSYSTGHGRGTGLSARDKQLTDMYAFLFRSLGMDWKAQD